MNNNPNFQIQKEIVDFINLTPMKTDIDLFQRLNTDELTNIYINCLIYLGQANSSDDFELNEEEENLFATVVRDNKTLKILKVTALLNHLFKRFGYAPNFTPVYILSPNLNITQSTLMKLLDTKKRIDDYKNEFKNITHYYEYTVQSHNNLIDLVKQSQDKNNEIIKVLEEGKQLSNDLKMNIEKYSNKINELNPLINNNKENLIKLNDELNKNNIQAEQISKQIEENNATLSNLKERVVPEPENLNKIIDENKVILNNLCEQQNNLQKELDYINKNNQICSKINDKLKNLKENVEIYHDYDVKNKGLYEVNEKIQNDVKSLEKEINECKVKYSKNVEILKNTELMLKNQQKEFNSLKSKLSVQIKENEKIKNDLKEILDHVTNDIFKFKSEIDKINFEKNELQNIRNEYAQVLGQKFQELQKKQNLYYKLLDKSIELYQNYNLLDNKQEHK